jgi:hypothetical protein
MQESLNFGENEIKFYLNGIQQLCFKWVFLGDRLSMVDRKDTKANNNSNEDKTLSDTFATLTLDPKADEWKNILEDLTKNWPKIVNWIMQEFDKELKTKGFTLAGDTCPFPTHKPQCPESARLKTTFLQSVTKSTQMLMARRDAQKEKHAEVFGDVCVIRKPEFTWKNVPEKQCFAFHSTMVSAWLTPNAAQQVQLQFSSENSIA